MFSTPSLSHHSFKAALQLFGWLLFHPSAWKNYVEQINNTITPNFAWYQLSKPIWQHREMQRLRYLTLIIWPFTIALIIGFNLAMIQLIPWTFAQLTPSNFEIYSRFPADLILGVSYGTVLYLVSYTLSSHILSMPFALVASVLGSILIGLLLGSSLPDSLDPLAIVLGILALSVAGSVMAELQHQSNDDNNFSWHIGSWVVGTGIGVFGGIVISIIILIIVLVIGAGTGGLLTYLIPDFAKIRDESQQYLQIIGMAVTLGLFLGSYFHHSWRQALKFALLFGGVTMLLMILILGMVSHLEPHSWEKRLLSGLTGSTINAIAFIILFTIPYLLAQRIASTWAGVIAGILGSGGIYLGVTLLAIAETTTMVNLLGLLVLGILAFGLGISQRWWLPILFYPFESASNLILSRRIQQQNQLECARELLPQHSAFWHEHQWLPLRGLETLLVNIYELEPALGQAAILQLSNTPQSWAVQATQIESNIQQLTRCNTLTEMAQVHYKIIINDNLTGDVGNWLRGFAKTSQHIEKALQQHAYEQLQQLKSISLHLTGFLTLSADTQISEINRFRQITDTWLKVVDDYVKELINVQTIPNPYVFGPPVEVGQGTFVARPHVSKRIENLLLQPLSAPLLLYGQRRTGKTSLLKNLFSQLPINFVMLFVDFQGPLSSVPHAEGFFYNLIRMIIREAKIHYPKLQLPSLSKEALQLDPITYFDEWLDELEETVPDKTFFLALDEFITLDKAFEENRLAPDSILGMFRNLIQHRNRFRLLFSGTHTFEELTHWASYLINVNVLHLNYLLDDEAEQLIEYPLEHFPLRYTPTAKQRVMALTRNHPGLIQLLCGEIVTLKDRQTVDKRLLVEPDDVKAAIPIALEVGSFFFNDLPNQIDQPGKQVLQLLAAQGEGAIVSQENLRSSKLTDIKATLKQLLQRELIEKVESGYRFQVELIRRWFANI
jgi:hypothetical protein